MREASGAGGSVQTAADRVRDAREAIRRDRRHGLERLNQLFRAGQPPASALDGRHAGELVAVDVAPGVTQAVEWLMSFWMPWKGKHLSKARSQGDNVFDHGARGLFRILYPFYRGVIENGPETSRAFTFNTSISPGRMDTDRQVLRIDYDLSENPRLTIRRILDEVAQVAEGFYLGKIHFKWWRGRWALVGYFTLRAR